MEGLARLQASRRGYLAHVAKTFGIITDITDSTEPITPVHAEDLAENSIGATATKEGQVGRGRYEDCRFYTGCNGIRRRDMRSRRIYRSVLMEKIAFLQDFISPPRLPNPTSEISDTESLSSNHSNAVTNSNAHHEETVTSPSVPQPRELETEGITDTEHISENIHHSSDGAHHSVSRLPKLSLPYFSGDPLMWQSFWDSFSAAVHTNPNLTGVQKLNYLGAQLNNTE